MGGWTLEHFDGFVRQTAGFDPVFSWDSGRLDALSTPLDSDSDLAAKYL